MAPTSKAQAKAKADSVASYPGADDADLVVLTLAHPLPDRDKAFLGLPEDSSLVVGSTVAVSKNAAKSLINAGMVTVDPENRAQVRAALGGESPDKVAELANTEPGQAEAEAAGPPAK